MIDLLVIDFSVPNLCFGYIIIVSSDLVQKGDSFWLLILLDWNHL